MSDYLSRMTGNATPRNPEFSLKGHGARVALKKSDARAARNYAHYVYWRRRSMHLCTVCGAQDARTLAGRCRCQYCEDSHRDDKQILREMRKAAGHCMDCGCETGGRARCPECNRRAHMKQAEEREKRKAVKADG